jgi:pSer/pThr/pTyr-binding forkhead associated (FHA) protein
MAQWPAGIRGGSARDLQARIEAERRGAPFLVYFDPEGAQHLVELDPALERVTIGRAAANDVALPWDQEVSRVHAALERVGGEWTLVDDGLSRNGSWVGGARVQGRRRLADGDVVRVGRTSLGVRLPGTPGAWTTTASSAAAAPPQLSPAQRRVLVALCRPFGTSPWAVPASNQRIADELFLSVHAVKTHLQGLFQRFGIEDLPQNEKRAALARRALETGAIGPSDLGS